MLNFLVSAIGNTKQLTSCCMGQWSTQKFFMGGGVIINHVILLKARLLAWRPSPLF